MRQEHRQKVLLGVVGALSLGAGSYWFFGESTDPNAYLDTAPVERRTAAVVSEVPMRRKATATRPAIDARPTERKVREQVADEPSHRKERKPSQLTVHKEKQVPAC